MAGERKYGVVNKDVWMRKREVTARGYCAFSSYPGRDLW